MTVDGREPVLVYDRQPAAVYDREPVLVYDLQPAPVYGREPVLVYHRRPAPVDDRQPGRKSAPSSHWLLSRCRGERLPCWLLSGQ